MSEKIKLVIIIGFIDFFIAIFLVVKYPLIMPYEAMSLLISGSSRVFISMVIYTIILSGLAIIPFFLLKYFEDTNFYYRYIYYWLISSFIVSNLVALMANINPIENFIGYSIYIFYAYIITFIPMFIPAFFQFLRKKH